MKEHAQPLFFAARRLFGSYVNAVREAGIDYWTMSQAQLAKDRHAALPLDNPAVRGSKREIVEFDAFEGRRQRRRRRWPRPIDSNPSRSRGCPLAANRRRSSARPGVVCGNAAWWCNFDGVLRNHPSHVGFVLKVERDGLIDERQCQARIEVESDPFSRMPFVKACGDVNDPKPMASEPSAESRVKSEG